MVWVQEVNQLIQNNILNTRSTCFVQVIVQVNSCILSTAAAPQSTHLFYNDAADYSRKENEDEGADVSML